MKKLCIIGIDGMDFHLIKKCLTKLPNLNKLHKEGCGALLDSIFPPDSIPSWITIYTGLDPSYHGIIETIDYFKKDSKDFRVDTEIFRGRTFWDIAGKFGKKVCIINPFMAYPVWPVNGVMVSGPVFISGKMQAYPKNILDKYNLPPLGGIVDFPTRKTLKEFIDKTRRDTIAQAEFGFKLLRDYPWDLYFIVFLTLDRIQHFLWRYCDQEDPAFISENKYENTIKEFYKLYDQIIGRYMEMIDKETIFMVISDHGHGRGCIKNLNLNEFLRQKGYLFTKVGKYKYLDKKYFIEKIKNFTLKALNALNLEDYIYKIARFIPMNRELKISSFIINSQKSLAYLPQFAGMGPFGGICINKEKLKEENLEYEMIRESLIKEITELTDFINGTRIAKWVCKREEMYCGDYIEKFPDIIFELRSEYGVNWTLYSPVICDSSLHKKISGKHTRNGIIFLSSGKKRIKRDNLSIADIAPTILDILNIKIINSKIGKMNGKSLFR